MSADPLYHARAAGSAPRDATDSAPTDPLNHNRHRFEQQHRGRRVRRTVDLAPATHRALDIWQRQAADRIGCARVTGQEVLSALVDELLSDPRLSARITRSVEGRR